MINFDFQIFQNRCFLPQVHLFSNNIVKPETDSEQIFVQQSFPTPKLAVVAEFQLNRFFREKINSSDKEEYDSYKKMNQFRTQFPSVYLAADFAHNKEYKGIYLENPSIFELIRTDRAIQKDKLPKIKKNKPS